MIVFWSSIVLKDMSACDCLDHVATMRLAWNIRQGYVYNGHMVLSVKGHHVSDAVENVPDPVGRD